MAAASEFHPFSILAWYDACGWFCLAYLHFINKFYNKTGDIYIDTATYLDLFEDLDKSVDWKKNEYMHPAYFRGGALMMF